ncbi:MAG: hypothetical protein Q4A07_05780 [Coriobacteriales bacterium]|nr:hypothetical protein [Coriobacteriales bacterium]
MPSIDCTITGEGVELLGAIKGATISALEAVIAARENMAWRTVRIHLGDAAVDVTVSLRNLPVNSEGDVEEFGTLAVSVAGPGTLRVEGVDKETEWRDVGAKVAGITLVNDHVVASEHGQVIMERSFTQVIVFDLADDSSLVLDKGTWFSEMIAIGAGEVWRNLVYESSQDWADDPEEPSVRYGWTRTLQEV